MGVNSSGSAANGSTGVFTLGGPTAGNTAATGVLNVTTQFFLANRSNTNAAAGRSTGTFTINGGTANIGTDILDGSTTTATAGTNNTTLTLDGGTLNMSGHNIGAYASPINIVNLNSGNIPGHQTETITFTAPKGGATYAFDCAYHTSEHMVGTLTVLES